MKKTEKQSKAKTIKAITVSGKRKEALARAIIREGSGEIRINKQPISLLPYIRRLFVSEPLTITQEVMPDLLQKVSINVNVHGGGAEAQIEASRLAIARALVAFSQNKQLRDAFSNYDRHLLIADIRRKETRKPGDSKARAKRQKSYR